MKRTILIDWPSEKQAMFLRDRHKIVAYGGARGGGKSWALRTKAVLLAAAHPGILIMMVRRSYPELRENHIGPLRELLGPGFPYSESRHELTFPNGSRILFRPMAGDKDLPNFQGVECDVLCIDEATNITETQFKILSAIVRGTRTVPRRIYLTCNPGGVGHGWVKRLFVDRRYLPGENPEDYAFIPASVRDNKALLAAQPDYLHQLEALPPRLRKAWLEGDWQGSFGQVFEEFRDDPDHYADRRHTHVIDPFEIPQSWRVYRSFDWGYAKPFSVGWWAVDYDGVLYRIAELYGCTGTPDEGVKWPPDRLFAEIQRIESEHPNLRGRTILGVADPAIFASGGGESIADTAGRYRIYFNRGDHARIPGWMQFHYRLAFDQAGYPRMYVFKNCRAFIRTIPTLLYDKTLPEDVDTTGEDHVADETRYMLMARPVKPARPLGEAAIPGAAELYLGIREPLPPAEVNRVEVWD